MLLLEYKQSQFGKIFYNTIYITFDIALSIIVVTKIYAKQTIKTNRQNLGTIDAMQIFLVQAIVNTTECAESS